MSMSLAVRCNEREKKLRIQSCAHGIVKCIGEIVRREQVVGFIHLQPFNETYVVESVCSGKMVSHESLEALQQWAASVRCEVVIHGVEYITLDSLPVVA